MKCHTAPGDPVPRRHVQTRERGSPRGLTGLIPLVPAVLEPAITLLAEPLLAAILVELLKDPLCVGAARRAVLDALGVRYGRSFADQWEFVRFAEEQELDLALTSPPQRDESR